MHDKAGRGWVDAATVPGDKTSGRVENVDEGHEYEFRIVAVNKAGPSEPSDPSKPVIAKPRFRKLFNTMLRTWLQLQNVCSCTIYRPQELAEESFTYRTITSHGS